MSTAINFMAPQWGTTPSYLDIVNEVLGHCDLLGMFNLASTCRAHAEVAQQHLKTRIRNMGRGFFADPIVLRDILRTCDGVVSGSTALHLLLPASHSYSTSWLPTDLDIYVPFRSENLIARLLVGQGYRLHEPASVDVAMYAGTSIHSVHAFSKGRYKIDVIVSVNAASIAPVFQFHTTAVMNFVSADRIFCAYPALTMRARSHVNPTLLYNGGLHRKAIAPLRKYMSRGFTFEPYACRNKTRAVTDGGCMWVDPETFPCVTVTQPQFFGHLGVLDLHWTLGGMVCGMDAVFQRPRMLVIDDESGLLIERRSALVEVEEESD
ncbi:hypothetical protein BKA82DRAFT_4020817 [Pisolithus tinctorius]|nr:hypothetical protein BKA82DRAFT_4020817 [Pisolithus tinctorius]